MKLHWCFDIARISFTDAVEKIALLWLSRILLTMGRIDIGQYPVADSFRLSPLGTGTTRASFQSVEKIPVVSDKLKI